MLGLAVIPQEHAVQNNKEEVLKREAVHAVSSFVKPGVGLLADLRVEPGEASIPIHVVARSTGRVSRLVETVYHEACVFEEHGVAGNDKGVEITFWGCWAFVGCYC